MNNTRHIIRYSFYLLMILYVTFVAVHCADDDRATDNSKSSNVSISMSVDERVPELFPGVDGCLTYDSGRNVIVFAGGSPLQVWEWSDGSWSIRNPMNETISSNWVTVCYYPDIASTVLLCLREESSSSPAFMEQWFYDGQTWLPASEPDLPFSPGGEMRYDPTNRRLLYTGAGYSFDPSNYVIDYDDHRVWVFDGNEWTVLGQGGDLQVCLGKRAIGFDEARNRLVMSGYLHTSRTSGIGRTWEFDGQQWLMVSEAMKTNQIVYDRTNQQLLAIEYSASLYSSGGWTRVYRYDEGDWTLISETESLYIRGPTVWHDREKAVFSYQFSNTFLYHPDDTWQDVSDQSAPGNSATSQAAFMPSMAGTVIIHRNVVKGYRFETWFWDGTVFSLLDSSAVFPPMYKLLSDTPRERLLMWCNYGSHMMKFWVWSKNHWDELSTIDLSRSLSVDLACPFPPRESVIFHGYGSSISVDAQTWEYKNDMLTLLDLPEYPPYRDNAVMAFHEGRETIVLFGGESPTRTCLCDTWEFDGTRWREIETRHAPSRRTGMAMVYDQSLNRIILIGGQCCGETYRDIWAFDGHDWQRAEADSKATKRFNAAATYDPIRQKAIIRAGQASNTVLGSLIELTSQ